MRSLLKLLVVGVLASLWIGNATPARAFVEMGADAAGADATVACLYPLSGRGGRYGQDSIIGIQLALDYLSQAEGAPYPRLRVLVADTKSKASRAVRLARDFVNNQQARFLCGVVNSGVALHVTRVAAELGVFFIGTDHASSQLTGAALNEFYFRMTNDTGQSMAAGARYVRESFADILRQRPLRIAYLGPDYSYGYQAWQDFRTALADQRVPVELVSVLWPKLNEPDYTDYIQALIAADADLVVNALWGGDLVAFIRQAIKTPLFTRSRFANFDTGGNYEVLSELGPDMPLGLILSARHHLNWPPSAFNDWFVTRFRDLAGRYPSYAAEGVFSGILAIAKALKAAGDDPSDERIRGALKALVLKLPEDPDGFRSYMNPQNHQMQQVIAIGETVRDLRFAPAEVMLGNWRSFYPPGPRPAAQNER